MIDETTPLVPKNAANDGKLDERPETYTSRSVEDDVEVAEVKPTIALAPIVRRYSLKWHVQSSEMVLLCSAGVQADPSE
jgi:hypothetical protein